MDTNLLLTLTTKAARFENQKSILLAQVTCVDKAIVKYAAGATPDLFGGIARSLADGFRAPITFARRPEFALVWGVYVATYLTANVISTTCERYGWKEDLPKFVGVSAVSVAVNSPSTLSTQAAPAPRRFPQPETGPLPPPPFRRRA